jgi:hypothetical protein
LVTDKQGDFSLDFERNQQNLLYSKKKLKKEVTEGEVYNVIEGNRVFNKEAFKKKKMVLSE